MVLLAAMIPLSQVSAQSVLNSPVSSSCGSSEQSNITQSAQLIQVIYNILTTGRIPSSMFPSFENLILAVQKLVDAYLLSCTSSSVVVTTTGSPSSTTSAQSPTAGSSPIETVGIYSDETYTDSNLGFEIQAANFPTYAFDGTVIVDGQSDPVSMTIGQSVPILGFVMTLQSITAENTGFANGESMTSDYATLTIATHSTQVP